MAKNPLHHRDDEMDDDNLGEKIYRDKDGNTYAAMAVKADFSTFEGVCALYRSLCDAMNRLEVPYSVGIIITSDEPEEGKQSVAVMGNGCPACFVDSVAKYALDKSPKHNNPDRDEDS